MPQSLRLLRETPSQTAGPYVHIGLAPGAAGFEIFGTELGHDIAGPDAAGSRIRIEGTVIDGTGTPLRDVLLETWQANAAGIHAHPCDPRVDEVEAGFRGWGRAIPDFETGLWSLETVKPGCVTGAGGLRMAPHLSVWIVARGINLGLQTRIYFADEAEANAADPVLGLVDPCARRETLIAERTAEGCYRFDIHLQGPRETVFFDV